MFVLQVGIGKYVNAPILTGSVNDVVEMRKVLEGERYGIPPANIVTLTDEQGTKQKIFDNFRSHLIAKARDHFERTKSRDAVVLFQFSGHGSQVPDIDGDEKDDGRDETLVTYDSRDEAGKNFDITDDEIFALTAELRRWTDNIVYVLDSCHSGSGTRDSQDVRRVAERKTVPVSVAGMAAATRSGTVKGADDESGVLPPGDDYIVITAARSGELASQKNCFEECGDARRPVVFGNLTFYLVDELRNARSDTSYRELMENVTRRVTAEKPTQTPQLEGDKSRFVFGSLASKEDYFVRVADAGERNPQGRQSVSIAAGAMQGVTIDTVVSFYDKTVSRFDQAEPVATGLVSSVSPAQSTVLVTAPVRDIKIGDKASIGSPDLGTVKLKLNLNADTGKLTPVQKKILDATRDRLSPQDPVDAAQNVRNIDLPGPQLIAAGRWDVAILNDKFSSVSAKLGSAGNCEVAGARSNKSKPSPEPDTEVFYVAGKDFVPMYGFCLEADGSSESAAAERLSEVVLHLAHLKSVNAIGNRRSALRGKIVVKPIRLKGDFGCDPKTSRLTYGSSSPAVADPKTGYYTFSVGEVMWLEVTNNSPRDLYLTLLDLPPDGSVKVHSPRSIASESEGVVIAKNGGKRILIDDTCRDVSGKTDAGAFVLSKPAGLETFKLIASVKPTKREEFAFLERGAVTRAGRRASIVSLDDWTTVETILQISDTGK
jgi:hypothetical protein